MRHAIIPSLAALCACAWVIMPVAGQAQLGLGQGGLGVPDLGGTLGRVTDTVSLDRLQDLNPAQAAQELLRMRDVRLATVVRDNRDALAFDDRNQPAVRDTVLITGANARSVAAIEAAGYVTAAETVEGLDLEYIRVTVPTNQSLARTIKRLRKLAPGASVSSDPIHFASGSSSVPVTGMAALAGSAGSMRGAIGLIDGGVGRHPALTGSIQQKGFAKGAPAPDGHGTAVASLLVGSGPVKGAAPNAPLLVADVYGRDPAGGSALAIAKALGWMAQNHVRIVTISLAGPENPLLARAMTAVRAKGIMVVAAVGNDGPAAPPAYPASYPGVIAVTGVDGRDRALIEAGRALHLDFSAPGADMVAAHINGRASRVRGTSFAAPFVAGRLYQHVRVKPGDGAMRALAGEARDLGRKGPDKVYGRGLVCGACRNTE